jgi:AcrR family transcriptional regulator
MAATSPPAKARRTGGRSARVREAVLRATLDALLTGGADDLSIRDVAQRAGVHETSVYRRWGTRANLILDAVLSEVQAAVPVPDTGSLRGDLLALVSAIAAFITTPLGQLLLRLALRDDLPGDHDVREQFWAERFTTGQTVLRRAQDRGELRPGLDGRLIIETLLGALYARLLLTREPIDDTLTEHLVDLVLAGIAAPGSPARPGDA